MAVMPALCLWLAALLSMGALHAAEQPAPAAPVAASSPDTLETLDALVALRAQLRGDIESLLAERGAESNATAQAALDQQIAELSEDLAATETNFAEIATGADLALLAGDAEEQPFNFQEELFSLAEPLIKEMKGLTSHVRAKTVQRDRIAFFEERLPVVESALDNLTKLLSASPSAELRAQLERMQEDWRKQQTFMSSQLQSARLQLTTLESDEVSLGEASQSYIKSFVNKRGRYLGLAVLTVLGVLLLGRLVQSALSRWLLAYSRDVRSFQMRLLDLIVRMLVGIGVIVGPMVVFYLNEDWMLFSLSVLLLLGVALTLRAAIPRFWNQIQLFLNVGSVREGERLEIDGMPWRVKQINFFSTLENPATGLQLRLKIDDLVDRRSRPLAPHEPWFPCELGDWVRFENGWRGRVVGVSTELVRLVERGGAQRTMTTGDFLAAGPTNLSTNFRLRETVGVSYDHIAEATGSMLEVLQDFVAERIEAEGYGDDLLNLRVEFERANDSSLDLLVIADFDGSRADIYNRLRRALQRWCVAACHANGWDIPFPQVTLHQASVERT